MEYVIWTDIMSVNKIADTGQAEAKTASPIFAPSEGVIFVPLMIWCITAIIKKQRGQG